MILSMIMAIESHEESSFVEEIYFKYHSNMLAICNQVLHNPADAEDALVDAFENIIRTVGAVRTVPSSKLPALLHTYAYNAAIDLYRKNKKANELFASTIYRDEDEDKPIDLPDETFDLEQILVDKELIAEVFQIIKKFPPSLKSVALFKWQFGYRNNEIAEVLHISESAVSTRILRARQLLRNFLTERYTESHN